MQKVLVAEIGSKTTIVNAFGNLDTENPLLLGQGISSTTVLEGDVEIGLGLAVADLEKDIGPVGAIDEIPFYATSSLPTPHAVQEINGQRNFDLQGMQGLLQSKRFLPSNGSVMQAVQLIYEEVGDVLVIDVGETTTHVYSITLSSSPLAQQTGEEDLSVFSNALPLVRLIGENIIKEHHGEDWERLLKSKPETPEEMALIAELTAGAVIIALERHCGRARHDVKKTAKVTSVKERDLSQIRWIVGTGAALSQLPNGLEILRESIKEMADAAFPQEGIAILLDKDCIMASLGMVTKSFRAGAWELLLESFGVEN